MCITFAQSVISPNEINRGICLVSILKHVWLKFGDFAPRFRNIEKKSKCPKSKPVHPRFASNVTVWPIGYLAEGTCILHTAGCLRRNFLASSLLTLASKAFTPRSAKELSFNLYQNLNPVHSDAEISHMTVQNLQDIRRDPSSNVTHSREPCQATEEFNIQLQHRKSGGIRPFDSSTAQIHS